nr:MAK10-like protein [Tanacetum cinerariifolium]
MSEALQYWARFVRNSEIFPQAYVRSIIILGLFCSQFESISDDIFYLNELVDFSYIESGYWLITMGAVMKSMFRSLFRLMISLLMVGVIFANAVDDDLSIRVVETVMLPSMDPSTQGRKKRSIAPKGHSKGRMDVIWWDFVVYNRVNIHLRGSYYSFPCSILSTRMDCKTLKLHPDVPTTSRQTIDQAAGGKIRDKNPEESWALLEDLDLYDNESWNDPEDFAKPVKAISLPLDVQSTSDRRLIKLENQVQRLMEAHLAPKSSTQVNKIASSCEICSGPHDTQYCVENTEQAFVDYASLCTNEVGDARLSKFEADFKQQQSEMTIKIDTILKAINDRLIGSLPSDTVKKPKLNVNRTYPVLYARSYLTDDPKCSCQIYGSINTITMYSKQPNKSQYDQPQGHDTIAVECKATKEEEKEEKGSPKQTNTNPPSPPNPSTSFIIEKKYDDSPEEELGEDESEVTRGLEDLASIILQAYPFHVLAPSGGGLIIYQACDNLYAMTAFGWLLEEIYMIWDHLKKKQTRLRLYTKSLEEIIIQTVETASPAIATASELDQNDVRIFKMASEVAASKETLEVQRSDDVRNFVTPSWSDLYIYKLILGFLMCNF